MRDFEDLTGLPEDDRDAFSVAGDSVSSSVSVIDLDLDEDDELHPERFADFALNQELQQFHVDEDEENLLEPPVRTQPSLLRNAHPIPPRAYVDSVELLEDDERKKGPRARTVKVGDTIELKSGDFLRVHRIIKDLQTDAIMLRGLQMRRNKFFAPTLPRRLNELYMVVSVDEGDDRPWQVQGLEEVALASARRKRHVVITNTEFPKKSFREHRYFNSRQAGSGRYKRQIFHSEVLVCRHLFVSIYGIGERASKRRKPYHGLLRFFDNNEADDDGGILTRPHLEGNNEKGLVDLTADDDTVMLDQSNPDRPRLPSKEIKYTYADSFQGAGGASSAARKAGLEVKWGFDHDEVACSTSEKNFPRARIFHMRAQEFPPRGFRPYVDILHISPPCQPFSPAHTNDSEERDAENRAALFCVEELIKNVRPRIVTLEQTLGILIMEKNELWFQSLLAMIQRQGYSMRWAILNFRSYSLPQPRKRLVIIASAPGIPLPEFPKPTHGEPGTGLLPFTTVWDAVGRPPRNVTLHDVRHARSVDHAPYDPHAPLKNTICTQNNGTDIYHWSGRRAFTLRELAVLQGFNWRYQFEGTKTQIAQQIGNAVPPVPFNLIFEQCIKTLREVDARQGAGPSYSGQRTIDVKDVVSASPIQRSGFRNVRPDSSSSSSPFVNASTIPARRHANGSLGLSKTPNSGLSFQEPASGSRSRLNGRDMVNAIVIDDDENSTVDFPDIVPSIETDAEPIFAQNDGGTDEDEGYLMAGGDGDAILLDADDDDVMVIDDERKIIVLDD